MRKLTEGETFLASVFVPLILVLSSVYAIVVHGWLGGFVIGEVNLFDFIVQMIVLLIMVFLPGYLILKYAGKKDISNKSFVRLE
jgi:hypothetical protein